MPVRHKNTFLPAEPKSLEEREDPLSFRDLFPPEAISDERHETNSGVRVVEAKLDEAIGGQEDRHLGGKLMPGPIPLTVAFVPEGLADLLRVAVCPDLPDPC